MDFTKSSYRLYCQKRVAILEKNWKNYKKWCLRYSKIFIYHIILKIIKKELYAIFLGYLNDTEKWKKWNFFGLQREVTLSGNIFKIGLETYSQILICCWVHPKEQYIWNSKKFIDKFFFAHSVLNRAITLEPEMVY